MGTVKNAFSSVKYFQEVLMEPCFILGCVWVLRIQRPLWSALVLQSFLCSVSPVGYSCAENAAFWPLGSQELSGLTRHP